MSGTELRETLADLRYGSLEHRFAIERAKIAGDGPVKALMLVGPGIAIFWEKVTEYWGPLKAGAPMPIPPPVYHNRY